MQPRDPESIRMPAVAGRFYPAAASQLERQVREFLSAGRAGKSTPEGTRTPGGPIEVCGAMAPHAGYVYSGGIAGAVFAGIAIPRRVILMCPNHTGAGHRVAVVDRGAFRIPGADIPVDGELADAILAELPDARVDREAHRLEHAIEVELPFLLARQPELRIVPVVVSMVSEEEAIELGHGIHRACCRAGVTPGRDVLFVASSDMSHYLPDDEARRVDAIALEPLLDFEPRSLYRTVAEQKISMCGFIPATAMLTFARDAQADKPTLVGYTTSAEAFGDTSRVVGYAGVVVPRVTPVAG